LQRYEESRGGEKGNNAPEKFLWNVVLDAGEEDFDGPG